MNTALQCKTAKHKNTPKIAEQISHLIASTYIAIFKYIIWASENRMLCGQKSEIPCEKEVHVTEMNVHI